MKIAILFVGTREDGGFNECALTGARRMQADGGGDVEIVGDISYEADAMARAVHDAATRCDGVVFVGGQGNAVTQAAAEAFPDRAFAVVQGNLTGPNLASYDVLQEQSAFLAGVLAARVTRSGVVGHLSGHRVAPGLKGRAAFAAGLRHARPDLRLVTGFCGTQDDGATTESWANAIADERADILFTMLNAARDGATRACRMTGMRQIGNVTDWCATDPQVFVASAIARIDLGVERAVSDMRSGRRPADVLPLGLHDGAVRLALTPNIDRAIRDELAAKAEEIASGSLQIDTAYEGVEFEVEP